MFESCLHRTRAVLTERERERERGREGERGGGGGGCMWAGLDSIYRELNTTMTIVFYELHETTHQNKPFSLHSSSVALKMIYQ